jgi:hypothetical protein
MFYPVQIVNYLNYTGTVYFEYLGTVTSITVSANQPYLQPLYVPKGALYRLYNNGTASYLDDTWTPIADNVTSGGYVVLQFGSWEALVLPPEAPVTAWEAIMPWLAVIIVAVVAVGAFGLVVRDKNRKIRKARGYAAGSEAIHSGGHR